MSVYIIAEAGINHDGNLWKAQTLADEAKKCGADAVKFQTYVADDICRRDNPEYGTLKRCQLSHDQFRELKKFCDDIGIDFLSTPDTVKDAEFLDTLYMRYIKIGSANANDWFIRSLSHLRTPLIVSLGMQALVTPCNRIAHLMHCVSAYPCPLEQANMARIGGNITGFSDHTLGVTAAMIAVARGAVIVEKHFTLRKDDAGPDHLMSTDPGDMRAYVLAIRSVEKAMGNGAPIMQDCEVATVNQLWARR